MGSGVVIPRQWATKEEAADPRDDIGTPVLRAYARISLTMRNRGA